MSAQVEDAWLISKNGNQNETRLIFPGRGNSYNGEFKKIDAFHFVQFGVYPLNKLESIKVPKNIGQVWVIYHPYIRIKGVGKGAIYIVKPFLTEELARAAIQKLEKKKIKCWYNSKLTGSDFRLIGAAGF